MISIQIRESTLDQLQFSVFVSVLPTLSSKLPFHISQLQDPMLPSTLQVQCGKSQCTLSKHLNWQEKSTTRHQFAKSINILLLRFVHKLYIDQKQRTALKLVNWYRWENIKVLFAKILEQNQRTPIMPSMKIFTHASICQPNQQMCIVSKNNKHQKGRASPCLRFRKLIENSLKAALIYILTDNLIEDPQESIHLLQ